jgi:hypothetical protein
VTRKIQYIEVNKSLFINYWQKATEFRASMKSEVECKRWNSASSADVKAGISANDALLVYKEGICCKSQMHVDAVKLLKAKIKDNGVNEAAKHLTKLIYAKNTVDYDARLYKKDEAYTLEKHLDRFMDWAESLLPG